MRAVVQRVDSAAVEVEGAMVGSVGKGLLVLLGVEKEDTDRDLEYLLDKVAGLRIFEDENGKLNRSAVELGYSALVVSNFTLYGDMSDRMMSLAAGLGPTQEIYSIDLSAPGYCCVSFEKEVVDWCCD